LRRDKIRRDDLRALFADVGLDIADVESCRLDVESRGQAEAALVLVVTTYAKNENGKHYFDRGTDHPAMEVRRFYIYGDFHLGCT